MDTDSERSNSPLAPIFYMRQNPLADVVKPAVFSAMDCIAIKIDPARLTNPDADMRYELSDLLAARSAGVIHDDGYEYVGSSNLMVVYLSVTDLERARACIVDVIANVRVLENDLRQAVTVAIQRGEKYETIYPVGSDEEFVVG